MEPIEIKSAKVSPAHIGGHTGAPVESQLNSRADIAKAHKFFSPGAETHAAAAAPGIPGSESAALSALPGAKDPISPLVQMIMRMPGHISLVGSFFEALQAFFLPHTDLITAFDPSVLGSHAPDLTNSGMTGTFEHDAIDPAILPPEAHILENLNTGFTGDLSLKTPWLHSNSADMLKHSLNVSGQPGIDNPVYEKSSSALDGIEKAPANEQASGLLAGPAITQSANASHLAGSHPIFSKDLFDRTGSHSQGSMLASAPSTPQNPATTAQFSSLQQTPGTSNALFVSGNPIAQHMNAVPATADMSNTSGATNANFSFIPAARLNLNTESLGVHGNFGPSGAVSDTLGAKTVLGNNDQIASNFRPASMASSNDLSSQPMYSNSMKEASSTSHAPLKELKAQELSLDGTKAPKLASSHQTSAAHANASHKASNIISHKSSQATSHITGNSHVKDTSLPASAKAPAVHSDGKTPSATSAKQTLTAKDSTTAATTTDKVKPISDSYSVHNGDSLWKVAEEKLGDATRWPDIYKLNVDKIGANPDLIHPGLKLDLPEQAQDIATPSQPSSEYIVQSGDNLWDIAKHVSGSGTHWSEIYHLNENVIGNNPRLIFPGEKLSIPSGDTSTAVADASGTTAVTPGTTAAPVGNEVAQVADSSQMDATTAATQPTAQPTPTATSGSPASAPVNQKLALSGAGGAEAADLTKSATKTADASIVSPSLAPDLSFFTRKR